MKEEKGRGLYNVVVIGGGTAGLVTAAGTAGLGGRVALVERHLMGGDCLNTGCVPSKALIASARLAHQMRHASRFGLPERPFDVSLADVLARVRERRAAIAPHDSQERFESLGVDVFRGTARFVSPHEVDVDDTRLRARHFVIATGSRPTLPPIEGLAEARPFTHETVFDELPPNVRRMVVIGGGPIGCELGQAFARLGIEVTLLEAGPHLLDREDEDARACVRAALESDGLRLHTAAKIRRVTREKAGPTRVEVELPSGVVTLEADAVLVAAGRAANVNGFGLSEIGVEHAAKGIRVDPYLRTSQRHIFAAGDVVGSYQFTHLADHHARTIVRNILFPWIPTKVDAQVLPWCTYTSPEVARVGLNEGDAQRAGIACDALRQEVRDLARAVLEGEESGFAKVLLARGRDRILGATLVAEHAGELIHEFAVAMRSGLGLSAIGGTIHAYPTRAEIAHQLADQYQRRRLTPRVHRLFAALFRWRRQGS
jgi:pyruvate/2-oxoglutarate dehydrogenase complex dihydrolipoamide dehydrogenase (E3) component